MSRWFYNYTIDYMKITEVYSDRTIRKTMRTNKKYDLPSWWTNTEEICPIIISGAVRDACKGYKSAFALYLKNHKPFTMGYRSKLDKVQCLCIEQGQFSENNNISMSYLGEMKGYYFEGKKKILLSSLPKIDRECRLNVDGKEYYLYVPYLKYTDREQVTGGVISLDSGVRTFQTGYCHEGYVVDMGSIDFSKLFSRVDILNSKLISTIRKSKKRQLYKKLALAHARINNQIEDMHWKVSNFLTRNYSTILLSDFKTHGMLKGKGLCRIVKRQMQTQSHYKFKQRLEMKCQQRGNRLLVVGERYTTKTCGNCGYMNNIGSSKEYKCKWCDYESDRDHNAARNILIKNLHLL